MTKETILAKLRELQPRYEKEGFIIKGIFGSFARDEADENSDIDILYDLNPKFIELHMGFYAISRLETIKNELKILFHREIDLATIDNPSRVFQKYTKEEAIYV